MGNYKDDKMEMLSNHGDGNYAYIDTITEARRVLVEKLTGTFVTIAKDVKVQVFFNPKRVAAYRLIGYANRLLNAEDFNDDSKDAGDIGAGHTVTAFYEIVPVGVTPPVPPVDDNPFVKKAPPADAPKGVADSAVFRLRLRYKQPEGGKSTLMEKDVTDGGAAFDQATDDFRFAAAVAAFGMALRESKYLGRIEWDGILEIAGSSAGDDEKRKEFLALAAKAKGLAAKKDDGDPLDVKTRASSAPVRPTLVARKERGFRMRLLCLCLPGHGRGLWRSVRLRDRRCLRSRHPGAGAAAPAAPEPPGSGARRRHRGHHPADVLDGAGRAHRIPRRGHRTSCAAASRFDEWDEVMVPAPGSREGPRGVDIGSDGGNPVQRAGPHPQGDARPPVGRGRDAADAGRRRARRDRLRPPGLRRRRRRDAGRSEDHPVRRGRPVPCSTRPSRSPA